MITKLLTSTVNIMQVILLLTTYSFLPVAILVNFEFTGQLNFSNQSDEILLLQCPREQKDLNNME